jgi:hypothetical protein
MGLFMPKEDPEGTWDETGKAEKRGFRLAPVIAETLCAEKP